jgi:2-(1,2-epoxy-1,2-dihydrophenyl)acetyl-CoA isomerase
MSEQANDNPVLVEQDGGLAVITLNRAKALNALDEALAEALLDAMVACDQDPEVRAVMLTGAGAAFCSGGDIRAMAANLDAPGGSGGFLKKLTVYFHGAIATMARMRKPVIAAVNGAAAGGGFSLALSCDLLVAAESATFTLAYTKIGVAPDGSSTFFLPRVVGSKRALDLIARNPVLSAAEAKDLGIVAEVFPDPDFAAQARAFAAGLGLEATRALGEAKQLLNMSPGTTLETQMEYERRAISACAGSADFREGIGAFLAKRKPHFKGV